MVDLKKSVEFTKVWFDLVGRIREEMKRHVPVEQQSTMLLTDAGKLPIKVELSATEAVAVLLTHDMIRQMGEIIAADSVALDLAMMALNQPTATEATKTPASTEVVN